MGWGGGKEGGNFKIYILVITSLPQGRVWLKLQKIEVFKVLGCLKMSSESKAWPTLKDRTVYNNGLETEQNSIVSGRIISRLHPITIYTYVPSFSSLHKPEPKDIHNIENIFIPHFIQPFLFVSFIYLIISSPKIHWTTEIVFSFFLSFPLH